MDTDFIKDMAGFIKKRFNPQKVILFGSHAYGNPTQGSDIDFNVIVAASAVFLWFMLIQKLLFVENVPGAESGWFMHLVIYAFFFSFGLGATLLFDMFFIKKILEELRSRFIAGVIGIMFCIYGALLFIYSIINWQQVLSMGSPSYVPKIFACFFFGVAVYVAYGLVDREIQEIKWRNEKLQ